MADGGQSSPGGRLGEIAGGQMVRPHRAVPLSPASTTNHPSLGTESTRPSSRRRPSALRTVGRLTPCCAASDGSDGSAHGVHLRWALLRSLEDHLPKGNLAGGPGARYLAPYGFNKAEDFVTVLRVPYDRRFPCTVSFLTDRPAHATWLLPSTGRRDPFTRP